MKKRGFGVLRGTAVRSEGGDVEKVSGVFSFHFPQESGNWKHLTPHAGCGGAASGDSILNGPDNVDTIYNIYNILNPLDV